MVGTWYDLSMIQPDQPTAYPKWRITTDPHHGNANASNGLTTTRTPAKAAALLLRN
jgi:hypothetical protein